MIRDITIGQYYPVKSRIHSLDPRVKIICTLLFLVSLFVQSSFLGYVIATLFLGMVIYMSKVPLKYIVKGLKPIVILLMFTVVMNLFLTRGGETLLHFYDYGRRRSYFGVYGASLNVSCGGIVSYDVYDISQRIDGRNGKTAESFEQASSSGS